jgi:large subunit ribosomal protein L33
MAAKGNRILVGMQCQVCKQVNYLTSRNKINVPEKLVLRKFCKRCRKVTEHKETTKLK